MLADSTLPCFAALGEQTANQLRDRFQQGLTQAAVEEHVDRLIDTSLGSNWTRLYDSVRLSFVRTREMMLVLNRCVSINTIHNLYYEFNIIDTWRSRTLAFSFHVLARVRPGNGKDSHNPGETEYQARAHKW